MLKKINQRQTWRRDKWSGQSEYDSKNKNKETDEETTVWITRETIYIRMNKVRFQSLLLTLSRAQSCTAAGWKWRPQTLEFNSVNFATLTLETKWKDEELLGWWGHKGLFKWSNIGDKFCSWFPKILWLQTPSWTDLDKAFKKGQVGPKFLL
jgi:hypothetical protein